MYILERIAYLYGALCNYVCVFLSVPTWMLQAVSQWFLLFSLLCAVNGEGEHCASIIATV